MLPAGAPQDARRLQIPQILQTPQTPQAPQIADQRFRRSETLRKTTDYRRCYANGRRKGGSFLVLHSLVNGQAAPRFGQTASRKVGGAVERHRLKRWAREVYRRWPERHRLPANDLIAHFKPAAAAATFDDFRRELERLLGSLLPRVQNS